MDGFEATLHPKIVADIVLHPQGCLGICDGLVSYFLMVDGVTRLHTHHCRAAWKVE